MSSFVILASGSSGFGRRRGVRGSEESLLSAARSVGGGLGEGGTSECKMCNEGVDGRDFLNLTVDEMMHIRQVRKIQVKHTKQAHSRPVSILYSSKLLND